jgi:hypothetical protein
MHANRCSIVVALGMLVLAGTWAPTIEPDTSDHDRRLLEAHKVGTTDAALLAYLRGRSVGDVDARTIAELVRKLGDETFAVREEASRALVKLGKQAESPLELALKDSDIEVVRRAEECLRQIRSGAGLAVDAAVLRMIARSKPAGAAEAILAYLPSCGNHLVVQEAQMTLTEIAVRDGRPDKSLQAALADKNPRRRTAAAIALARTSPDHHAAVRALLQDPDLDVRLRAVLALVEARDKLAVPALIDLLPQLTQTQVWEAEDMLFRIAGDKAPRTHAGKDEADRKKCRDAWTDWWTQNGGAIDLGKLAPGHVVLGHTITILLDDGIVQEHDSQGKMRWQLKGIDFPLDAQMLPGDRLLLAEHGAARVTERNLKTGEIVWQKELRGDPQKEITGGPLVAQRLPNGNTFIATDVGLTEVNPKGEEVFQYRRPLENIRKAIKLRNGDIALVTSSQRFIRLGPDLKDIRNFEADVRTNGGRIEVLPNGNVLIPLKDSNRIVECDPDGKAIWEATVIEPIAALRLPNGHTLVTTLTQRRAIELDGAAQTVWEFKSGDSRVTRAWRR